MTEILAPERIEAAEPALNVASAPAMPRVVKIALTCGRVFLFWIIVALALDQGLRLRDWAYRESSAFRFRGDIANAWGQGMAVVSASRRSGPTTWDSFLAAYLDRYDLVIRQRRGGNYHLDYPPARLFIMSAWAWYTVETAGRPMPAPFEFRVAKPLLALNTVMGLAAAVGAFLVARHVLRRQQSRYAEFIALLPALLIWFSPVVLLDAHVWPQWDVWVLPFYLFAAWFGLNRRWILTGACLGLGAMFKGQVLVTMAIFILWPLFQWRLRGMIEVVVGFLLSTMLATAAWMLRTPEALVSFVVLFLIIAASATLVGKSWRAFYICSTLGVSLLVTGIAFNGSFGWLWVGFEYGSRHHMEMTMGPTPNLAAILAHRFGWGLNDTLLTIGGSAIQVRSFLILLYALTLLANAIGMARHDATGNRRVLLAIAAPWVLMFAFMPQMHDRYLFWGGTITALCAAVSLGATLLHLVIMFLALLPIASDLLAVNPGTPNSQWHEMLMRTWPDSSWAMLLATLILLYLCLGPGGNAISSAGSTDTASPQSS